MEAVENRYATYVVLWNDKRDIMKIISNRERRDLCLRCNCEVACFASCSAVGDIVILGLLSL